MKVFIAEVLKTFLLLGMLVGVPVGFITWKYDVYETVSGNPVSNQIGAWGFVIAILVVPALLLIIKALFRMFPPRLPKRLIWGLSFAIPVFVLSLFTKWISDNILFIWEMLKYWSISLSLAFVLAPKFVINYMQERK